MLTIRSFDAIIKTYEENEGLTLPRFVAALEEMFTPAAVVVAPDRILLTITWHEMVSDGGLEKMDRVRELAAECLDVFATCVETYSDFATNAMIVRFYFQNNVQLLLW